MIVADAVPAGSCTDHGCDGDTDGVHETAPEEGVLDLDSFNPGQDPDGPLAPEETTVDPER